MPSRRIFLYRLYLVFIIAIIWVLFSLLFLYNIVEVDRELLKTRRLSFFSLAFAIIGCIIAAAEAFYLKNAFRKFPFWLSTILRLSLTFVLFLIVSFIFLAAYFVISYNGTFSEFQNIFLHKIVMTSSFRMAMIDMGVLAFLSIMILEITDKYGPGGIKNLLKGRYNKPRNEKRIFLFLDINDATTIAEKIGHEKYFRMLKDFFADITDPVLANSGHIYQYVGDEVSLYWKNTNENKLKCLQFVGDAYKAIKQKEAYYLKQYGTVPSFKVGIHSGEVTAGYIGLIKKELVFSGDTLNTTARIRSKCHELHSEFVLSAEFLQGLIVPSYYQIKEIGEIELKGKMEKEKLYSITLV
jgi:adenylate cyclase